MAMMFRGLGKPTDQLDIQIAPQSNGLFDGGMGPSAPPMPMPAPAADAGKIGTGRMIAGYVGDALAQLGGLRGNFAPAIQQHQEALRRAQQAQLQRQADRDDWLWKFRVERDNPATPQPTEFERILNAAGFSPEEKLRLLQQRARNTADPLQAVKTYGADGSEGLQFIRPSQMQGGGDPSLGGAGSPPAPSPSADLRDFITPDQMRSIAGGTNFQKWQQQMQTPVLVRSAEEMAGLPAGTLVVSPDGRRGVKK